MLRRFVPIKQASQNHDILLDRHRTVAAIGAGDGLQSSTALRLRIVLLLVPRLRSHHGGFDPDLQKMRCFVRGVIKLGMLYAATCAHPLQIAGDNRGAIAHGVAVR